MERFDLLLNGPLPMEAWDSGKNAVIDQNEWTSDFREEFARFWQPENMPLRKIDSAKEIAFETLLSERSLRYTDRLETRTRVASPSLWLTTTQNYLISFAWLAFYTVVSAVAASLSAYSFAHHDYVLLPGAGLAFVSFTVLALIRLRIHLIEHRILGNQYGYLKAS
jgi:hypothetical protein